MPVNLTNIFSENLRAYKEGYNLIINQGSTGSSKTWSIEQLLYFIADNYNKELVISICSYALPHLKMGAIREFNNILLQFGIDPYAVSNQTEFIYKIGKSIVEFFGIEGNLAKVHGPRRDILFINECNKKITYEIYDQMHGRTRICTFLDYNPTSEFWVHTKVMPNFKHKYIHSTWRDNPYLSDIERNKILTKYNKKGFENWVKVYGEGEVGILEGQIFTNWKFGPFDTTLPYGYGLDFGFHPNPDAMVKVAIDEKKKKIYLNECFYKPGQSTEELETSISYSIEKGNDSIVADCAEPRLISELSKKYNIAPVKKDGTVAGWIKILQGYELIITEGSYNLQKELTNHLWSDKKAGIPIDGFNHLISGFRYYFMRQKQKIDTNVWA
ncbi:unnamed protein product [marine sediment metagenome]|uniref:Phage terminase large subunit C-terminal domain-containing protein n=1 Tax=marine sediment metagenome TaxID=412755 RepID=X0YZL1_9ZZZZ